jgi:hypothetical protein
MSKLRCHISISLDGFVAGPNQSEENPLGEGGGRLHDWAFPLEAFRRAHGGRGGVVNQSTPVFEESRENIGAAVMGRCCPTLSVSVVASSAVGVCATAEGPAGGAGRGLVFMVSAGCSF